MLTCISPMRTTYADLFLEYKLPDLVLPQTIIMDILQKVTKSDTQSDTYLVWAVSQEHPRKDKLHRMLAGLHSGSAASVFDSIDPKECA